MRLPYAPRDPPPSSTGDPDPETVSIYETIAARRRPRPLIPLDLTLLQSPPVASGYNAFVSALRSKTIVSQALLELSICRVAILNSAVYEWNAHAPLALKAGLKAAVLEYAKKASIEEVQKAARNLATYSDRDPNEKEPLTKEIVAVLLYTDEMTKDVKVHDTTFDNLRGLFNDREIVELTSTIAGYNCVSRILVSLDVGENNDKSMREVKDIEETLADWKPSAG